jgi:xanthine dehydrogenase accessory factor
MMRRRTAQSRAYKTRRRGRAAYKKLKAPAGLDIGAITPDEIAISILAEIVAVRRGKDSRGAAPEDINQRAR